MSRSPQLRHAFWLVGLALLLAGCGAPQETDPAVPIQATAGREFIIVVKANPTTGYEWRLLDPAPAEGIARFVAKSYRAAKPVTVGSGGWDIWRFQAVGPGETAIHLGWFPPSGSETPQQTHTFTVRVR